LPKIAGQVKPVGVMSHEIVPRYLLFQLIIG